VKCVVPISGGIDSTVLLHHAVKCGEYSEGVYAISFDYGQRHRRELEYAKRTVQHLDVPHKIIDLNFFRQVIDSSSLTNDTIKVAKTRDVLGDAQTVNYVPFRNQMLLSICCAIAESVKADIVFHGAAQIDTQSGFWDGSKEFLSSINELTALNRKHRVKVEAPLIDLSKKEIIEWGIDIDVDFRNTWTCYEGEEKACGECTACSSRLKGFVDVGIRDPLDYSRDIPWDDLIK
jgi:7-cyano-7-deazaguanine synthase